MEEDGVVKAPVTRLRRRLSVEVDETKSPSAPSTPTKKRGGRLAAKPQLELIDENAPQDSPSIKRTTRKSIVSSLAEPEEKPVTPARRSTRVKSNTSLVLETTQVDSPRAKRAARRTSLVGSDTEAPTTPARARRTRKDSAASEDAQAIGNVTPAVTPGRTRKARTASTSSMDKIAEPDTTTKPAELITTVISEEPEYNSIANDSKLETISPTQVRKSPRVARKSGSQDEPNGDIKESLETRKSPRVSKRDRKSIREDSNSIKQDLESLGSKSMDNSKDDTNKLSVSSANLINGVDTQPKYKSKLNKSTSAAVDKSNSFENKRRTKSMTNLTVSNTHGCEFYSDNESAKKSISKKKMNNMRLSKADKGSHSEINVELKESIKTSTTKKKKTDSEQEADKSINTGLNSSKSSDESTESNKENKIDNTKNMEEAVELLFQNGLNKVVDSKIFIEDTDSNSDSIQKDNFVQHESGDQCVPEVKNQLRTNDKSLKSSDTPCKDKIQPNQEINIFNVSQQQHNVENNDCEPMDIDETMPENVSLHDSSSEKINDKVNTTNSKRKTSLSGQNADVSLNVSNSKVNKSKRKSSISDSPSRNLEKSGIEKSLNINNSKLNLSKRKSSASDLPSQNLEKSGIENSLNINNSKLNLSKRKSSTGASPSQNLEKSGIENSLNVSNSKVNKTKRKSSIGDSPSQNLEKSGIENKSTLVLSQLKDVSSAEQSATKSPRKSMDISKSQDVPDGIKDKIIKKNINITANYLTSTPVQQKEGNKLSSLNTSVITPNNNKKNTPKIVISNNSKTESSDDLSSSDDDSNLLDDEAEDAGDNYESGDSQNEEEREYERENEIRDKGVTLTSDEELSNDTDYEKDSFIVSSSEEDNELLSGSGDDLDMSANELTMSAKSKKKFNERNVKKQKKASREMFESRHGLNQSDEKTKSPKPRHNRLRLDSSALSGDDLMLPPKKNKRMRLDSTKDEDENESRSNISGSNLDNSGVSTNKKKKSKRLSESSRQSQEDVDETDYIKNRVSNISQADVSCKKKKSKRLSESLCNESGMNEKEISIREEMVIEGVDPLVVAIKQEPKTPQKSLDISTVIFTDRAELEEVNINENVSMLNGNNSIDPLQGTMAQDDESDVSISENEEATKNYESILNQLNKNNVKKIKTKDISLNLEKKAKKKSKQSIIEELNITQVKEKNKSKVENVIVDDDVSDSIDVQLLFSDESNDSVKKVNTKQPDNQPEANDIIIPLKKTESKTNIRENLDVSANTSIQDDSKLLKSDKKKKKRISESAVTPNDNTVEDPPLFVIDTIGSTDPQADEEINNSLYKNKNKNNSLVEFVGSTTPKENDNGRDRLNVSDKQNVSVIKTPTSEKKIKSDKQEDLTSASKESNKKKRKRKTSKANDESAPETEILNPSDTSKESMSNKNKKRKIYVTAASTVSESVTADKKIRRKRKEREDDEINSKTKILKANSFDKIPVPRLPSAIINELDDKPKTEMIQAKKAKLISTSAFKVEQTTKRRNKPSNYLEESIYLNDSQNLAKQPNQNIKKPKVLPFVPTATTSYSGFTTNFHVNVLPKRIDFVAKLSDAPNFKNSRLESHKCKIRTEKRKRNIQLSKF